MKARRRKATRKHRDTTPPTPPPIPPPDLTTEIEQSVEARDKLEIDAARLKAERDQSKSAFLRAFASEMRAVVVNPNRAYERHAAWQAQEGRATHTADAVNQLTAMFKERVARFKSNSKDESVAALQRIIERLKVERNKPGADRNAIDKRIERLMAELEALCAPPNADTPRPPKDKTKPTQRPAPGKTQPRERGEN